MLLSKMMNDDEPVHEQRARVLHLSRAARAAELRARNLTSFCELASGVDDDTWMYHLRAGDHARWIRDVVKDDDRVLSAGRMNREPRLERGAVSKTESPPDSGIERVHRLERWRAEHGVGEGDSGSALGGGRRRRARREDSSGRSAVAMNEPSRAWRSMRASFTSTASQERDVEPRLSVGNVRVPRSCRSCACGYRRKYPAGKKSLHGSSASCGSSATPLHGD